MKFIKKFLQPDEMGFVSLVALYIAVCAVIACAAGYWENFHILMYLRTGIIVTFNCLWAYLFYRLIRAGYILIVKRPDNPLRVIIDDLKKGPFRPELYRMAFPVFIGFVFFFSTFSSMKMMMPRIHPFEWDEFFMQADKALHFGLDPWRILQPVLGYPFITKIIAFFYVLWLAVFFVVLYWQLFRLKDQYFRLRFFYTFVLTWAINGTFLAMLFSSAGPCFYERVTGSEHFLPLMDYLAGVQQNFDLYALKTQELLWSNYLKTGEIVGGGISSFPSVHIATAFLFVLTGYHAGKGWFRAFLVFFVFILLGSVHLGWHYAVDGYFAILTTWGLWWISGRVIPKT